MRLRFPHLPAALWVVLIGALIVRVAGIGYGLPLLLVADEPPFTMAALKMLELKTLIPAMKPEVFAPILYYPPYLSYLYLVPFAGIIGGALLIHGSAGLVPFLLSDLSGFFIVARLISVAFALGTIYLMYRVAVSFFRSHTAGIIAAFLLATSVAHTALSMVGRHWVPVTFFFVAALFVLTYERVAAVRRYGYALIIAGIGMGVSSIAALIVPMMALHFFVFGQVRIADAVRSGFLWVTGGIALALALLPTLLSPTSNGFLADTTLDLPKSIQSLLTAPIEPFIILLPSEPVLILAALAGFAVLLYRERRTALFSALFIAGYSLVFFVLFRFETRFLLPLVPFLALLGSYALSLLFTSRYRLVALVVLALPLIVVGRLAWLSYEGDTRTLARTWVLEHLTPTDKVMVHGTIMRVSTTPQAVQELRTIDPRALRTADTADEAMERADRPHALNIYAVTDDAFFENLPEYAQKHGYRYLVIDTAETSSARTNAFATLTDHATVVASWGGLDPTTSVPGSSFRDPFWRLFSGDHFGFTIHVYELAP